MLVLGYKLSESGSNRNHSYECINEKNSIMLKKQKLEVKFTEKRYSELGDKELLHNFYNEEKADI